MFIDKHNPNPNPQTDAIQKRKVKALSPEEYIRSWFLERRSKTITCSVVYRNNLLEAGRRDPN